MTPNHRDELFNIPGYTMFRRDRNHTINGKRRKGGGLLIYAMDQLKASIFIPAGTCDETMELIWVTFRNADRDCFICGIYHPPKPIYQVNCLLQQLGSNLEYIFKDFPMALVAITGDFNQLPDNDIQNFGMLRVKTDPTRGINCLDRLYTSEPTYDRVVVIDSVVKSDHKAIYASTISDSNLSNNMANVSAKQREQVSFRTHTPSQSAAMLSFLDSNEVFTLNIDDDPQIVFDELYSVLNALLNQFYPIKKITVSNRDPYFMTPHIKACFVSKIN